MTYEQYLLLFYICLALSIISFLVAVFLFFKLRIINVIGDLSGSNAKKAIENIRQQNENSGNKAFNPSPVNKSRGKITDKITLSGKVQNTPSSSGISVGTEKIKVQSNKLQKAKANNENVPKKESSVLAEAAIGNETTVLAEDAIGNETTVLTDDTADNETTVLANESSDNETTVLANELSDNETTVLANESSDNETTVLANDSPGNETTVLGNASFGDEPTVPDYRSGDGETTVLGVDSASTGELPFTQSAATAMQSGESRTPRSQVVIEEEITFVHSNEQIN